MGRKINLPVYCHLAIFSSSLFPRAVSLLPRPCNHSISPILDSIRRGSWWAMQVLLSLCRAMCTQKHSREHVFSGNVSLSGRSGGWGGGVRRRESTVLTSAFSPGESAAWVSPILFPEVSSSGAGETLPLR